MLDTLSPVLRKTRQEPYKIIVENPYTAAALLVATIGGPFAGLFPASLVVLWGASILIIVYGIWIEAQKHIAYEKGSIALPIVFNIANPASSENALNSLFNIVEKSSSHRNHKENLHKYLGIVEADLIFAYGGDIYNQEMLKDFLKVARHDLEKVKLKAPRDTTLHLAYIGPISVAVLVGAMLGTEGITIYQYNRSTKSYEVAIEIEDRALKDDTAVFEKFEVERRSTSKPKVSIAVDAAAHKVKPNDPSIESYGDFIHLKNKTGKNIGTDEDWLQYSREIFKVLNEAQRQYDEIRLMYSMPNALGIVLGMAIQNYWNIRLTNYDSATYTYRDLIKTNEIRYFF
jgi:hypothetical protein